MLHMGRAQSCGSRVRRGQAFKSRLPSCGLIRPYRVMGWEVGDPRHRWKVTPAQESGSFSTRSFHLRLECPRPKEQRSDRKPQGFVKTRMFGPSLLGRFRGEGLIHRPLQCQSLSGFPRGRRTRAEVGSGLAEVGGRVMPSRTRLPRTHPRSADGRLRRRRSGARRGRVLQLRLCERGESNSHALSGTGS
jgi:hypothetical protein